MHRGGPLLALVAGVGLEVAAYLIYRWDPFKKPGGDRSLPPVANFGQRYVFTRYRGAVPVCLLLGLLLTVLGLVQLAR